MAGVHQHLVDHLEWDGEGTLLDIGCGAAALTVRCAKAFPNSQITAMDYWGVEWNYAKEQCEKNARLEGVENRITFQKGDAAMSGSAAERAAETGGQEQMEKKKRESGRIPLRERRRSGTGRSGRALRVDVALAAYELAFTHPETGESMIFQHNPSGGIFRQFQMPGQQ